MTLDNEPIFKKYSNINKHHKLTFITYIPRLFQLS